MLNKIVLNNKELHFSKADLPCLIHGKSQEGSSLLTVCLAADLYSHGSKVLFLCGYPMARQEFLKQTGSGSECILVENEMDLSVAQNKKAIFVLKENAEYFEKLLSILSDLDDRVILVKNFDLFDVNIFNRLKGRKNLIFSGNMDACSFSSEILSNSYSSKIYFSQPAGMHETAIPELRKYEGYFINENLNGIIRIE